MINNLKIIEDDDKYILSFNTLKGKRMSVTCKVKKRVVCRGEFSTTKIRRWNEKWSYEKEIECEERCQRMFQS